MYKRFKTVTLTILSLIFVIMLIATCQAACNGGDELTSWIHMFPFAVVLTGSTVGFVIYPFWVLFELVYFCVKERDEKIDKK